MYYKAVKECLCAKSQGFDYGKYDVFLKAGYRFTLGRYGGTRSGRFETVREFLEAKPELVNP